MSSDISGEDWSDVAGEYGLAFGLDGKHFALQPAPSQGASEYEYMPTSSTPATVKYYREAYQEFGDLDNYDSLSAGILLDPLDSSPVFRIAPAVGSSGSAPVTIWEAIHPSVGWEEKVSLKSNAHFRTTLTYCHVVGSSSWTSLPIH